MINLELYRIFYVVVEMGNITRASEKLNISQPAVTKQIKNLEDSLGCTLFIRTKKGVILNEDGKKIFIDIKQALSLINNAENKIKNLENLSDGLIKIGISTTLTRKFLFKYIKEFHNHYPNIKIEISTDPTSELIKSLKNGMIDFIIAKIPQNIDNEIDCIELGEMQDIFVVNNNYRELMNKSISISDILDYPIILQKEPSNSRKTINKYCEENNIKLNSVMSVASSGLLIDFVKAGYGIGFVTRLYVEDELKNKELFEINVTPKVKPNKFGIIKLKNNHLSFSSEKFIKTITK